MTRASRVSAAPTAPSPGSSCSAVAGTPALRSRSTAMVAISGVCSAGLASTALPAAKAAAICPVKIARGKIPRADAGKHPARRGRQRLGPIGIIAQEINRLAQFANRIGQGLARLARQQGKDWPELCLIQIRRPAQHLGADVGRGGPRLGQPQGGVHIGQWRQTATCPTRAPVAGLRISDLQPARRAPGQPRGGLEHARSDAARAQPRSPPDRRVSVRSQPRELARVPNSVGPVVMAWLTGLVHRLQRGQRAGRDAFGRHILVDDLVDEAGVGAVFQAAAAPDRPADRGARPPAHRCGSGCRWLGQNDVMQPLAHAMQALELETAQVTPSVSRHVQHRRDGMGVVGGELRIDPVGHAQQFAGIGDVADIGRLLAGEHRERRSAPEPAPA